MRSPVRSSLRSCSRNKIDGDAQQRNAACMQSCLQPKRNLCKPEGRIRARDDRAPFLIVEHDDGSDSSRDVKDAQRSVPWLEALSVASKHRNVLCQDPDRIVLVGLWHANDVRKHLLGGIRDSKHKSGKNSQNSHGSRDGLLRAPRCVERREDCLRPGLCVHGQASQRVQRKRNPLRTLCR